MTYCSEAGKYSDEQGTLLSNFWSDVDYTEGRGVNGQRYAQRMFHYSKEKFRSALIACMLIVTGCINAETLDRINPDDAGGQYDSSGGADGDGNPAGSVCTGYEFEIIASP